LNKQSGLLFRIVEPLDKRSELKWTSNAAGIISVTDILTNRIKAFVKKPAHTIINGFFEEDYEGLQYTEHPKRFLINYTGYLYGDQPVELLIDGFKRLHQKFADKIDLRMRSLGTAYHPPSKDRILNRVKGFESAVEISERVPREVSLQLEAESDVFVMLPYQGHKGIPGSKLYQYLGHNKPILVYPSDHDIIEETVTRAGTGLVCETEDEFVERVSKLIEAKINDGKLPEMHSDPSPFSRRGSTKELATLLYKY
jgi:glycosyltransferase involved in cell wall biosynthesis